MILHGSQNALKHGDNAGGRKTKEYQAWLGAKSRCFNPSNERYSYYGGRGVKMCSSWAESFERFLSDVGRAPSSRHTLDRWPDKNGDYEPGNVRWAVMSDQNRNKRSNVWIEFDGRKKILTDWASELGVTPGRLRLRLKRGLPIEQVLSRPANCIVCGEPLPNSFASNRNAHPLCAKLAYNERRNEKYHATKMPLITKAERSALLISGWTKRRSRQT